MATIRAKDSLRKEKKVAAPSSSPKPATATNSDHKLKSSTPSSSSSSAKPVPNYLKPTLSSKSESLKFVKKPNHSNNNEDPAQKQLLRRRSFDRPPSSVRAQTSLISSPDPKERVAASRIPNNRPSSASTAHTTSYYRPVLDRNSKSLKPVRSPPQQVHRPVANSAGTLLKRSKSLTKNNNSHSSKSPSSSIPPPPDETQDLNLEINQETTNNESLVQESAELEAVNNVEDMDVAEDSQVKDGGNVHHHEDENIKTAETSIVEEVSSVVSDQVEANEIELRHEVVDQDENIQEELEHEDQKEERDENQLDDTKLVDSQVIIDDRKEEENIVNEKASEEESEAAIEETKNEELLVSEEVKLKNEEPDVEEVVAVENWVEEGNQEINNNNNNNNSNSNATQNKKQPAAYNDVIEETKNKLLEKRKNKVKALVGAFETVIDYETAAGSNK